MTDVTAPPATLLRPDWAQPSTWLPQLAAHLRTPDGVLHLDATGDDPPAAVVHTVLGETCAALARGPLPEILLHDDPDELAAIGALPAAPAPAELDAASADEALQRARAVKEIADRARDHIDGWRFQQRTAPDTREPLVTIRIATWKGHERLVQRTLPSVLNGSYPRIEVVICSDGPDADARRAVQDVARRDPRVRYLELPERPSYPAAKINLHRIGGTDAVNAALDDARGDFICPLDHDDAFTKDHVSTLLEAFRRSGKDFLYGQALCELPDGTWGVNGFSPLRKGDISHGTVMYSSRLAHMRYDADGWVLGEPGDWNLWRRMLSMGVASGFVPAVNLVHFAERTSIDMVREEPQEPGADEALADLRATPGAWLLTVAL
jgi:hypothetical protein